MKHAVVHVEVDGEPIQFGQKEPPTGNIGMSERTGTVEIEVGDSVVEFEVKAIVEESGHV
jgi:hypothetical protein